MARYRYWLHDRDNKGQPLDESILKAAEEVTPLLARYRQQEIDCESTTNDILQTAVEAASKATRNKPIANPSGYLVSVYRRFVDRFLDHKRKTIAVGDDFLEDLTNVEHSPAPSFEEWMHNHILLEKLIELMDPETQRICRWRLEGYSEAEIANRLGVTANAVSVRFTRGFKEAAKTLLRGKKSTKRK